MVNDVYFGNSNTPALVQTDVESKTLDVALDGSSTYYWKIVAKDKNGGQAIGQTWRFKSE